MLLCQIINESNTEMDIQAIYEELGPINVQYDNLSLPEIQNLMQQVLKLLSIVNKLTPGPTKAQHTSRIMSYMNKVRGAIVRMLKAEGGATMESLDFIEQLIETQSAEFLIKHSNGDLDAIRGHIKEIQDEMKTYRPDGKLYKMRHDTVVALQHYLKTKQ